MHVNEQTVLGVGNLFIVLGTSAVAARFLVRIKTSHLAADDWFSLLAWVVVMGAAKNIIGSHSSSDIGPEILSYDGWNQEQLERFEFSFDVIQVVALAALKISVLLFYRRIFVTQPFKKYNSILVGLVVVWAITFVVSILTDCDLHISSNFKSLGDLKRNCHGSFAIMIALAASDVVVDLLILAIPVPLVLSLYLPLQKKIGVIVLLMIGMLATLCGIVRMTLFIQILGPSRNSDNLVKLRAQTLILPTPVFSEPTIDGISSRDDIGIVSFGMLWSLLEMGIAIVAICIPVLYRLLR